jgi:hypothetical protein
MPKIYNILIIFYAIALILKTFKVNQQLKGPVKLIRKYGEPCTKEYCL